ncbi:SRPBCC domain-containing protein [Flavobacterium sp. ZB4P13]|uniref:SRPBCC domain-containing protein n=1 Tax=Flavobacterium sp. ZB4P13 TaxID=3401728 RepID=UPI003AAEA35D
MNSDQLIIRKLKLNATVDKVWEVLTNPEYTKQFMFNCEAHSDWKVGSEIKWKGNFQGSNSTKS